ncbi:MAG: glyoxylase-like metal-dependent hydrolase (beta-lactamase superfamily II) [Polyangiales bacterium]|jgi:glyoxylase-like metal-dependent hydrolase (beta-lactamase superfamily II)
MSVKEFYDPTTATLTFVVWDEATKDAVVIDPVLDYDPLTSQTSTKNLRELAAFIDEHELRLHYVLETHAHADHLSGSQWLRRKYDAGVVISEQIMLVQETFKDVFDLPESFATDGTQFDKLVRAGERFSAGSLEIAVIPTPGHTPACVTFEIGGSLFVGDALFMDDYGTGRCDFPKGSADDLYDSVQRLYAYPDETRVFVGHDYPKGRDMRFETTIGASKEKNPQIRAETTRGEFVAFRNKRDAALAPPRLIFQSVQVNINAGAIPAAHDNGIRYLKTPLNLFGPSDNVGEKLPN